MVVDSLTAPENGVVVEDAVKDKNLPRALVKPHVLTHVINGHIIQEGETLFDYETHVLVAHGVCWTSVLYIQFE